MLLALATGCKGDRSPPAPSPEAGAAAVVYHPSALALRDIVGLSTHTRLGADVAATHERAFEWAKLAALGIHRIRTDFAWSSIEPSRGTYDFASYDTLVQEAAAHGVDVLAILDYGAPWATSVAGADAYYPPDDPADFAAFAAAVGAHFAGSVRDYEIWNEPNNGVSFWKPTLSGDPSRFGALVLEASGRLRAAAPGANVVYGGTVYDFLVTGPDFVDQSLRATPGLASALGTLAMHAYQAYPPSSAPEAESTVDPPLLAKVSAMRGVLADAGAPSLPIWITELGWPTTDAVPPAQQARFTVRAVVLAALAGADRLFLYTLEDGPHPAAFPPEDAFGLVGYQPDWSTTDAPPDKPAFVALQALMSAAGSRAVRRRLDAKADDVYLIELAAPDGAAAWIAWRSLEGAPAATLSIPATGRVRVTRIDGTTHDDVAGPAGYEIAIDGDPTVVVPAP